jgi:hypothetical protein
VRVHVYRHTYLRVTQQLLNDFREEHFVRWIMIAVCCGVVFLALDVSKGRLTISLILATSPRALLNLPSHVLNQTAFH